MNERILDWGMRYLFCGYGVLLTQWGKKTPHFDIHPRGFKDAIYSPFDLEEAVSKVSERVGIAIVAGEDVVILDLDSADAVRRCEQLIPSDKLSRCAIQLTPSGGWHLFFRVADDLRGQLSAVTGRGGIDIRGLGKAYVVAHPTQINGREYIWARGPKDVSDLPELTRKDIARILPQPRKPSIRIAHRIDANGEKQSGGGNILHAARVRADIMRQARVGERHMTFIRCAAGWLNRCIDEHATDEVYWEGMMMIKDAAAATGLLDGEIEKMIRWVNGKWEIYREATC